MSKNNQLDVLVAAAEARCKNLPSIEPKPSTWGMFACDDVTIPCQRIGLFTWYRSKAAMLDFVEEVFPYVDVGPDDKSPLAMAAKVKKVIFAERAGSLDLEKARKKLNLILRSHTDIEWMGTFKDLMDGKETYAKKVIKEFRETHDLNTNAKPIVVERHQMKEFKEFVANYGVF